MTEGLELKETLFCNLLSQSQKSPVKMDFTCAPWVFASSVCGLRWSLSCSLRELGSSPKEALAEMQASLRVHRGPWLAVVCAGFPFPSPRSTRIEEERRGGVLGGGIFCAHQA